MALACDSESRQALRYMYVDEMGRERRTMNMLGINIAVVRLHGKFDECEVHLDPNDVLVSWILAARLTGKCRN